MFLSSRWGIPAYEVEQLPYSEFSLQKSFWELNRWGMVDDLLAIQITHFMRSQSSKVNVQPWMVKEWTTQKDYTYKLTHLVVKSASAIRAGFMAIYDAIKGIKKNG